MVGRACLKTLGSFWGRSRVVTQSSKSFWQFDGSVRAATASRWGVQVDLSRRLSNSTESQMALSISISIYIAPASSLDAVFFLFTQILERCHPRLPSRWIMFLALCTCPPSSRALHVISHPPIFFCSHLDIFLSNALIHQLHPHLSCTIITVKASLESDSFSPSFSHRSCLKSELLARPIRLRASVLNMTSHVNILQGDANSVPSPPHFIAGCYIQQSSLSFICSDLVDILHSITTTSQQPSLSS